MIKMLSHPNNASLVNIQSIHVDYFALIVMLCNENNSDAKKVQVGCFETINNDAIFLSVLMLWVWYNNLLSG